MITEIKDTLLILGTTEEHRDELKVVLSENYNLLEAQNITQCLMLLENNRKYVAMLIINAPDVTNDEIRMLSDAANAGKKNEIPLIFIADSHTGLELEERALLFGALDVILKPFSPLTIQRRIRTIMDLYAHKNNLEKMVDEQSVMIRNTNQIMLDALSAIIEYRSTESGNHVLRIRRFTKMLLEEVMKNCPEYELTEEIIEIISSASTLHDIGKISVPDAILNKPGRLTEQEFEIMKTHSTVGSTLVRQLSGMGDETYLRYAYNIALYHHERWDGNGYPEGLSGDDIPICAQVVGLADVFDALTTKRVYKPAYPYKEAINMILNGESGHFSPKLLECFKHIRSDFVELASQYADGYSPKSDNIAVPLPTPKWQASSRSTLQLIQAKQQALLHYIDDTVIELDLDNDIYHVVYNPNPVFDSIIPTGSFDTIIDSLSTSLLYSEDKNVIDEMQEFVSKTFRGGNEKRRSFFVRLYDATADNYQKYEIVFLRVDSGNPDQHLITVVWHREDNQRTMAKARGSLHSSPALYGLVSTAIRCELGKDMHIDAGTAELYQLTGFTEKEILNLYGGSLMKMIAPEDHKSFEKAIRDAERLGGKMEAEFRIVTKNSGYLWVLVKGRAGLEADGREYFYLAIRDNSKNKMIHQQLLSSIERSEMIIEESGAIIFEWNLIEDNMYCSPKWQDVFGYVPVSENYGSQLGIATHFHPDSLSSVQEAIKKIHEGEINVSFDVRIANVSGQYLWMKITAVGVRDDKNTLIKIIGMIQNIDELKKAALELKDEAERDALTRLFNKATTESRIDEYFHTMSEGEIAGIIAFDLDNFKSVNDTKGHLFGDMLLSQVGLSLKRLFRTQDIIGRIGGDEFVVLIKNIPDRKVLKNRCELLRDTMRMMFEKIVPDVELSCSIGAAIAPVHGKTYVEVFRHADEALYSVKNNGKNDYRIYSVRGKFEEGLDIESRNTRIDSDDPGRWEWLSEK